MDHACGAENIANTFGFVPVCVESSVGMEACVDILELEVPLQIHDVIFGGRLVEVAHYYSSVLG